MKLYKIKWNGYGPRTAFFHEGEGAVSFFNNPKSVKRSLVQSGHMAQSKAKIYVADIDWEECEEDF